MKIAIIYSHLKEFGGAERVILKQVDLFHKKGYDAECFFAYVDKNMYKESPNPHCYTKSFFSPIIPNTPEIRIILSMPFAPLTLSVFGKEDVLICHGYGPAPWIGYLNKKFRGLKYVSYVHSPPRFLYLNHGERALWRFNDVREIIFRLSKVASPFLRELDYLSVVNSDVVLANSYFRQSESKPFMEHQQKFVIHQLTLKPSEFLMKKLLEKFVRVLAGPSFFQLGG